MVSCSEGQMTAAGTAEHETSLTGAAAREARKARQEATGAAARQARKERLEAQKEAERRTKEEAEAARQERVAQAAAARRKAQEEAAAGAATTTTASAPAASDAPKEHEDMPEDEADGEVCLDPGEEEARRKRLADKIAARRQAALEKEKVEEEKRKAEEEKARAEEQNEASSSDEAGGEEKEKSKKRKKDKKKKKKEKKRRKVDSSPSSDAFDMAKKMAEQAAGCFAWERQAAAPEKVIVNHEPGKAMALAPDHVVHPDIERMCEKYTIDRHAADRLRQLPMSYQKAALKFQLDKTGNPSALCMTLLAELLKHPSQRLGLEALGQ